MDNKQIKTNATELNDEALENVSGGLLKPIILDESVYCKVCGKEKIVSKKTKDDILANGGYYCDACKANMAADNT